MWLIEECGAGALRHAGPAERREVVSEALAFLTPTDDEIDAVTFELGAELRRTAPLAGRGRPTGSDPLFL